MPVDPFLSVVVTTHRPHYLVDCVRSLSGQHYPQEEWELLVVDDAHDPRTESAVADAAEAGVRATYLPNPGRGGNAARNAGAAVATGSVLVFIDDDEMIPADHLERVERHLRHRPDVAGVGGPYRDLGKDDLRTCSRHSLAAMNIPGEGLRAERRLFAGNFAVTADVFRDVGPFDEDLRGWGDEDEWFHRAEGRLFLYDPDLWVYHRRDQIPLLPTLRYAFWQGRSVPRVEAVVGPTHTRSRWLRLGKRLMHGVSRRCTFGLVEAARELGAIVQNLIDRLPGRARDHSSR